MGTWLSVVLIILGLLLLKKGADWFVFGSQGLARRMGVSELAIGLTIVAFGTSAPELVVNTFASANGNDDIVFGNIIGSNIFNLFIILSIVGLINPIKVRSSTAWREIPISLAALIILLAVCNDTILLHRTDAILSRLDALILLGAFGIFLYYVFSQLPKDASIQEGPISTLAPWKITLLIIAGLIGLIVGGKLVLDNAVKIASSLGMSEKLIGLTIVAAGTSLPELATSIVAASKKNHDIAVGNIIGSNIFNVLFIIPISALIKPLHFDLSFNTDIFFLSGGTALLLLAMYTGKKMTIDRWEALVLLIAYAGYLALMIF